MAKVTQGGVKEKVASVREVVPGPSNNEIHLVLQYYDNDVEKAIQAFLEDGAKEALQEWHYPGNKVASKKKKKNKPKKQQSAALEVPKEAAVETKPADNQTALLNGDISSSVGTSASAASSELKSIPPSTSSQETSVPSKEPTAAAQAAKTRTRSPKPAQPEGRPGAQHHRTEVKGPESNHAPHSARPKHLAGKSHQPVAAHGRERTVSEVSTSSSVSLDHHNKPYGGIERSQKDLQRQNTSLKGHKKKLQEQIDKGYKDIQQTFEKLQKELNDREVHLIRELDKVKIQAEETLKSRQELGEELKRKTYTASNMTDQELAQLRLEIKSFVSDRKIDEDLGSMARFKCDITECSKHLQSFGEIVQVKGTYNKRHPSVSSVSSSVVSPDDLQSPTTPLPVTPSTTAQSNVFPPTPPTPTLPTTGTTAPTSNKPLMSLDLKSDSLSTKELAELQQRLQDSLIKQGLPPSSGPLKRNPRPAPERNTLKNKDTKTPAPQYDSSDEGKKSRTARRRQKQRERQKEQRYNNQDHSLDGKSSKENQKPASDPPKNPPTQPARNAPSNPNPTHHEGPQAGSDYARRPPRKSSASPNKRSVSGPRGDGPPGSRSPRRNRPGQYPGYRDGDRRRVGQDNYRKPQFTGSAKPSNKDVNSDNKNAHNVEKSNTEKQVNKTNVKVEVENKPVLEAENKPVVEAAKEEVGNGPVVTVEKYAQASTGSDIDLTAPVKEEVKSTQTDAYLNGDAEPLLNGDVDSLSNNNNSKYKSEVVSVKESMKEKPVTVSLSKMENFQEVHDSLPQRHPRGPRRNDRFKTEPREGALMNGDAYSDMNGTTD